MLPRFQAGKQRRLARVKRNTVFSYLNAKEASNFGLEKTIKSYPLRTIYYPGCTIPVDSVTARTKYRRNHMSEATVLKSDGSRYIYGIPVYNKVRQEVSFSISPNPLTDVANANNPASADVGMIPYVIGADNSVGNSKGKDNYYESTKIPAYAHSHLLSAVLSPDYFDKTGNGISEDDLGNGVKLNYTRTSDAYKWRLPIQAGKANYNEGRLADIKDDKASYLYGEKQMWYMHSIESKTMVAQFYISPRTDGFGVLDENGTKVTVSTATQASFKLDSIKLFTKAELKAASVSSIAPTPIKTVVFSYDYSLCLGVPNSIGAVGGDGKLTLKSIYFTYGNSGRGRLNAYKFSYKQVDRTSAVFGYNGGNTDRWGSYKRQVAGQPLNSEFPYATQVALDANDFAGAWCLNKIDLPSGATIKVEYESDTYSYVQDKRAGQMLPIAGFVQNTAGTPANVLYTGLDPANLNLFAVVNVPAALASSVNTIDDVKARFFQDIKQIYFKVKIQLTDKTTTNDWVSGYADFDLNSVVFNNTMERIFIPLTSVASDKPNKLAKIHPLSSAGLQMLRLDLPELAYENPFTPTGNWKDDIWNVASRGVNVGAGLTELFQGYDKVVLKKGFCKNVDLSRAWVRLACPTVTKYGGGSRVKKISVDDNWATSNVATSSYGQEYTYTTRERVNGVDTEISSGVASYEPIMGGEENTLRNALPYYETFKHAPDNAFYTETPVGENLYPSAVVGYSEVKVRTLNNTITRTGTGYTITKYFTARDYPTTSRFTVLSNNTHKIKHGFFRKFLKLNIKDHTTASQGFVVETNDMHGKMKQELVYNELGSLLKSTTNTYRENTAISTSGVKLNNNVPVIKPDGTISTVQMGVDTDVWTEMNQDRVDNKLGGVDVNMEGFLAFILPVAFPFPYPMAQSDSKMLRTSITTKFIKRFGILDEVKVMENGSTLTTKNVLFDSETGDVLLTQTQNEFEDPMYNFKYPAHWAYDGMGLACKNIGLRLSTMDVLNGALQGLPASVTPDMFLTAGDELIATIGPSILSIELKVFVARNQNGDLRLIDSGGRLVGHGATAVTLRNVKVIRSGRRNMATVPIGEVASRQDPRVNGKIDFAGIKPLQASATTFSEQWKMPCEIISENPNCAYDYCVGPINPYSNGIRGNWRPESSVVYHGQREQVNFIAATTDIRSNGNFGTYNPYWLAPVAGASSGAWAKTTLLTPWVQSNRITGYDTRGNETENLDPLGIFSSASFGYNQTRAVDITSNSQWREAVSDNFEDYGFANLCPTEPINNSKKYKFFKGALGTKLQDTVSHTGRFAVQMTGDSFQQTINLIPLCTEGSPFDVEMRDTAFYKNCIGCTEPFRPRSDSFFVSLWVASDTSVACGIKPNAALEITFYNQPSGVATQLGAMQQVLATGPVIDGWRRIFAKVVVPPANGNGAARYFKLNFRKMVGNQGRVYTDDFRIHNTSSNMKSFVYDPVSMRLMAQLDENNYATFYEYDDEGLLVRVKRESDKGVVTVQESRTVLKPNN
jgi:hypothetical protein